MKLSKVKVNVKLMYIGFIFILYVLASWIVDSSSINILSNIIYFIGTLSLLLPAINKKHDTISTTNFIPFMFMMYAMGPIVHQENYQDKIVTEYLLLQLIGLICLILGLSVVKFNKINPLHGINYNNKDIVSLKIASNLFVLLALFSVFTEVIALGGIAGVLNVGYGTTRIQMLEESAVIGGGFQWLILGGVLLWYTGYKIKSKIYQYSGILLYFLSFLILFLTGGRSSIVYSLLFFMVIYHFDIKKIKLKTILILIFLGIMSAQLYSNARYYLPEGIQSVIVNTTNIFINNPRSFLPLPENISEFQIPAKSLMDVLTYDRHTRFSGQSYIYALGTPFPFVSRVFSRFGVNIAGWYLMNYYIDIYTSGAGLGFSPVTESYLNFGYVGVVGHMFLYGWFGGKIYSIHKKYNNILTLILLAGVTPMLMLEGLRIHLSSVMYKLFRIYLFPLIIFLIVRYIIHPLLKNK